MNIQIFGRTKCFDTKSAERYFKERNIKYQFIDVDIKGLSPRELTAVRVAVGDIDKLINPKCPLYTTLNIAYIKRTVLDKEELLLNNFKLFTTPIVRNGKLATVGLAPDIWKNWD